MQLGRAMRLYGTMMGRAMRVYGMMMGRGTTRGRGMILYGT